MKTIEKIKAIREDKDIRQIEIAEYLNISQSTYSKYERGESRLQIEDLKKICLYLNISADWLLGLPEGLPYPKR